MRKLGKLGLAIFLVAAIFAVLWFSSPYFRAWARHPVGMYKCEVEHGLPGEWCMGLVLVAGRGSR